MVDIQIIMAGATAIILFIFGLENFSREIERISGEKFRKFLGKATKIPIAGVGLGALITAVVQSSSATSVIAIGLVDAGVLSFRNSVGIIFGSNVGTTVTAQLVAFKLTAFAPVFIILGFLLTVVRSKFSIFGKTVFYFGFVFFSLNLISASLAPLQSDARLIGFLTQEQNPFLAILFGCLFTALVQSSSVTTGLAVIFTQQGLMSLENAVPIIMGANIGTTATAALAMIHMDISAKKTALSHFLFNFGGVVIFTPVLLFTGEKIALLGNEPALALANFHLLFNVSTSIVFILLLNPFVRLVEKMLGEGRMDFERIVLPAFEEGSEQGEPLGRLREIEGRIVAFLQENYTLVMLSIETNYKKIYENGEKRLEYLDYLRNETLSYFSRMVGAIHDERQSKQLLNLISRYDYLFQIHDSIKDLFNTKKTIDEAYIDLNRDLLMLVRDISSRSTSLFSSVLDSMENEPDKTSQIDRDADEVQVVLDKVNRKVLGLMVDPKRRDAGALTHLITYSQRLKDKLVNFSRARKSDELEGTEGLASQPLGNGKNASSADVHTAPSEEESDLS